MSTNLLGVDTGGTFTDFVILDSNRRLRVHKVLSTPEAPERAILAGIRELGLDPLALRVVHGSTVATNAVLEGKGAHTVYVTNRGFADVLAIGRQARAELYELQPVKPAPPVAPEDCLEVGARLAADGGRLSELDSAELEALAEAVAERAPEAVAINLLYAYLDSEDEDRIASAMPADVFVSRSSQVLAEQGEYERGITTWLNAYVGPRLQGYLRRLHDALRPAPLSVMQSSGETMSGERAGERGVHLLLSGPAGGLAGAQLVARLTGRQRLLTFDMGGTSTDVALVDGRARLASEGQIGRYPLRVPHVDIHTIGAGGGSIAFVDAGGVLQVGPESAGAAPGPACYGRGGCKATVTDANLVLGRLLPEAFLGGGMRLDIEAAMKVISAVAERLGVDEYQAAEGIVTVADEHMARALQVISVQRGEDPREFSLCCFGGAGGLHVCALAERFSMQNALVPVHAGVLSALGMLVAPRGRQLSRAMLGLLADTSVKEIDAGFRALEDQGCRALVDEGLRRSAIVAERSAELRYRGQSHSLRVPWRDPVAAEQAFHAAHQRRYGHRLDLPVELVTLRVGLQGPLPDITPGLWRTGAAAPSAGSVRLSGIGERVPVWHRESLVAAQCIEGPALVAEPVSTTFIASDWQAVVDRYGNLLLSRST